MPVQYASIKQERYRRNMSCKYLWTNENRRKAGRMPTT